MLLDEPFFAFFSVLVVRVAAVFGACEGLGAACSSLEATSVEELGEYDLDCRSSDCLRLAKVGVE